MRKPKRATTVSWPAIAAAVGPFAQAWLDRADLAQAAESLRSAAAEDEGLPAVETG